MTRGTAKKALRLSLASYAGRSKRPKHETTAQTVQLVLSSQERCGQGICHRIVSDRIAPLNRCHMKMPMTVSSLDPTNGHDVPIR